MEVQRFHFMKHFAGFTLSSFMGGKKAYDKTVCGSVGWWNSRRFAYCGQLFQATGTTAFTDGINNGNLQ